MDYRGQIFKGMKAPCRGCGERYPGCHDHCERYQEASTKWEEYKMRIRKVKHLYREADAFKIEGTIRSKKHGK